MHRLWPDVLDAWASFADQIVVLDDNSTDGTTEHALDHPAVEVFNRDSHAHAWGTEHPDARSTLFRLAAQTEADWILILDADMVPLRSPRDLALDNVDAVAFPYYDLWSVDPLRFREDRFWYAHRAPRIWMMRNPGPTFSAEWNSGSVHCGHFPKNLRPTRTVVAPFDYGLAHFGYASERLRQVKHEQYRSLADDGQLTEAEMAHAETILDPDPRLVSLRFDFPLLKFLNRSLDKL